MWSRTEPSLFAAFLSIAISLGAQLGACDDDVEVEPGQEADRTEQEFAGIVEKYNQLMQERRFDEAIVLAKQAWLMQPAIPIAELMVRNAKHAKRVDFNKLKLSIAFRHTATGAADATIAADGSITIKEWVCNTYETIEPLVFGGDEEVADGRRLLDASLERRIAAVDKNCRLTDAQKHKLRIAGRGDIKRFFDRAEALRQTHDGEPPVPKLGSLSLSDTIRPGLFDQGSFFSKTLKISLTEGQAAAFEASAIRR